MYLKPASRIRGLGGRSSASTNSSRTELGGLDVNSCTCIKQWRDPCRQLVQPLALAWYLIGSGSVKKLFSLKVCPVREILGLRLVERFPSLKTVRQPSTNLAMELYYFLTVEIGNVTVCFHIGRTNGGSDAGRGHQGHSSAHRRRTVCSLLPIAPISFGLNPVFHLYLVFRSVLTGSARKYASLNNNNPTK